MTALLVCLASAQVEGSLTIIVNVGGAEGRSAISALLKLVSAGSKGSSGPRAGAGNDGPDAGGDESSGHRRARGTVKPLARPLIAICNDLYAPALRPLRAVAKVVHFKKPSVSRHTCKTRGFH